MREDCGGTGRLEVVSLAVVEEGDSRVEDEDIRLLADPSLSQSAAARSGAAGTTAPHFVIGAADLAQQQPARDAAAGDLSGRLAGASLAAAAQQRSADAGADGPARGTDASSTTASSTASAAAVACTRRAVADVPEEFASRRERFLELDQLQPGWEVPSPLSALPPVRSASVPPPPIPSILPDSPLSETRASVSCLPAQPQGNGRLCARAAVVRCCVHAKMSIDLDYPANTDGLQNNACLCGIFSLGCRWSSQANRGRPL